MSVQWNTPSGNLGTLVERTLVDIPLSASSDGREIAYSLIAGSLPRGLRLVGNAIKGSATEVRKYTTTKFVIRADDGEDLKDRTFSLSVDGSDVPEWVTDEGFLKVGQGESYFVLDNAYVEFQLEARDPDINAGDILEYYLVPNGGTLPPGLSLSKTGIISGFTDPVFAIEYSGGATGAYDAQAFDITPLDKQESKSNGFDSYIYDGVIYDYSESSQAPKRLSRFYSFVVAVTDGVNEIRRLFRIYVVTEEFLRADNSIVEVDTNLFQADNTGDRLPFWITDSYLGRYRANNYVTIFLDVYDPPSLAGVISYILLNKNPDGSDSVLPPGMVLDGTTGEIAGRVPYQAAVTKNYQFTLRALSIPPTISNSSFRYRGIWNSGTVYQINDTVEYLGLTYICVQINRAKLPVNNEDFWKLGVSSADRAFTIDLIGEIESAIEWKTRSDLGIIKPNQSSRLQVVAENIRSDDRIIYEFVSGNLPPGLELQSSGIIQGKVKQFSDDNGPGLTRFYERDSSILDSTGTFDYNVIFDNNETSFGRRYNFIVKARDSANFAQSNKMFTILVQADSQKTFANIYIKAFQNKSKRLEWFDFITDSEIFRNQEIYRFGDTNFGIQNELKILMFAGIESVDAVKYIQAISKNHYNKRIRFGDLKYAQAKDPATQETIYEVVYVEIADEFEKNNVSVSSEINLSDTIESKILISYDAIKVDSNIPLASDSDHQRVFPNSFKNMRKRIREIGETDREYLPLWMRSIQDNSFVETGYVKSLVLCYTKPGFAESVISRIKFSGFDFKNLDFTADRYVIDVLNGKIENKYLAFPQRGEKLP
jgi:hypothetical protein